MTPFGELLRRERQERKLLLGEMARMLKISAPYLSQLETGRRSVPDGFADKVVKALSLNSSDALALERAAALSRSEFILALGSDANDEDRALAHDLADAFTRLSPEGRAKLRELLEENKGE